MRLSVTIAHGPACRDIVTTGPTGSAEGIPTKRCGVEARIPAGHNAKSAPYSRFVPALPLPL